MTDATGSFSFANVPFNSYHLTVALTGFAASAQDVDVRSSVPVNLKINLLLAGSTSTVTVEATGEFNSRRCRPLGRSDRRIN